MANTLDELRTAARAWVRADEEHAKLHAFGAHESARAARERANGALRAFVTAADLHAARGEEGLAALIRSGHSLESAKRVRKLRSQAELERVGRATTKAFQTARKALGDMGPQVAAFGDPEFGQLFEDKPKRKKVKQVIPTFGEMKRTTAKGGRHALDRMAGKPRKRTTKAATR